MNANDLTFGCEFEVTLPREACPVAGGYHRGVQIPGLPAGWNAQTDASIRVTTPGYVGVEIVSPVLKGAEGIRQVKLVCDWLKARNAKVNQSTGFHVHVGCERNETLLARLAHLVANFEKALYVTIARKGAKIIGLRGTTLVVGWGLCTKALSSARVVLRNERESGCCRGGLGVRAGSSHRSSDMAPW